MDIDELYKLLEEEEKRNNKADTETAEEPSANDTPFEEEPLKEQVESETQPAHTESVSKQEQVVFNVIGRPYKEKR